MESSATVINADLHAEKVPGALVVGYGLAASLTCVELLDLGFKVSMVEAPLSMPDEVYCSVPNLDMDAFRASLSGRMNSVEIHRSDIWPSIWRHDNGFSVEIKSLENRRFDTLFFSGTPITRNPETSFQNICKLYNSQVQKGLPPQELIFLMDYQAPTDPAVGMSAILSATKNSASGGKSSIIFKNAPVRHPYGETLYDEAKASGVMFYRYSEDTLQVSASVSETSGASRITVVFRDVIDSAENLELSGDQLFMVTGPNPADVPPELSRLFGSDVDRSGFLVSESIHCNTFRSFNSGIYCVGGFTGVVDLVGMMSQAEAAAAHALTYASASKSTQPRIQVSDECVRCLTCHRICPHSAVWPVTAPSRSKLTPIPNACFECGICVSECPRMAIDLTHFPGAAFSGFIDDLSQQKDKIVVYGCSRSAGRCAAEIAMPDEVIFFSTPCAGRVSQSVILDTIAAGVKGLLVIGCHHGNCVSKDGTDWACDRVKATVTDFLKPMGLGPRLEYNTVAPNEARKLERIIRQFADSLKNR